MNEERWPTLFANSDNPSSGGHLLQKECKPLLFPTIPWADYNLLIV